MRTLVRWILIVIGLVVVPCGILIWVVNSPTVEDYYHLYYFPRESSQTLNLAFTIALRRNHSLVYEITTSNLHARLDEWMQAHPPQLCSEKAHLMLGTAGTNVGHKIVYRCVLAEPDVQGYRLEVDDIVIKDMKIVDWGEVVEEFD